MVMCCVKNCNNRSGTGSSKISFYKFPKDAVLRKSWLDRINRENFTPSIHAKVCSEHFKDVDKIPNLQYQLLGPANYVKKRPQLGLRIDAVPSLKLGQNDVRHRKRQLTAVSQVNYSKYVSTVLSLCNKPKSTCRPSTTSLIRDSPAPELVKVNSGKGRAICKSTSEPFVFYRFCWNLGWHFVAKIVKGNYWETGTFVMSYN